MLQPIVFVVGPTGSGKSKLALMLARKLKAEIVSADSMQIYCGMNIGTAKPTKKEQKLVPHHLLDKITSRSECSVYRYCKLALDAIQKIIKKKRIPMIVGGSGFYIKALIDGLGPLPGKQVQLRKKLEQLDTHDLHDRLKRLDPELAKKIHVNNKKRIIRAIEIICAAPHLNFPPQAPRAGQGGKEYSNFPISSPFMGEDKSGGLFEYGFKPIIFGLERDRRELYERIERRVDQMFAAGWVNEVKRLKRIGFSKTARYAIGYKEILEYLAGKLSEDDMKSEIKKRTRHLAKKQLTWFRKDKRIKWYFVSGGKYASIVNQIFKDIQSSLRGSGQSKAEAISELVDCRVGFRPPRNDDTGN